MKKEFSARPERMTENWCAWQDFLTAMPSLVFLVTGWKANGKENACLQSWASFVGSPPAWGGTDDFFIYMPVSSGGHMHQSLTETGVCVLNFPSCDIYDRCIKTIGNNAWETDEITAAGLTAESAVKVNAPRVKECFLNIECVLVGEHAFAQGYAGTVVALKAVHLCMDSERYDQNRLGRYGETGYLFQVDQPTNPETAEKAPIMMGTLKPGAPIPWDTK